MDEVINGTKDSPFEGQEAGILRGAGIGAMQKLAGYVPQKMPPINMNLDFRPLSKEDSQYADELMSRLCGYYVYKVNPRVPYLMAVWLLIGRENPYQLYKQLDDVVFKRTHPGLLGIVPILLRIACGDNPTQAEREEALLDVRTAHNRAHSFVRGIMSSNKNDPDDIKLWRNKTALGTIYALIGIIESHGSSSNYALSSFRETIKQLGQSYGVHVYKFIQNKARSWAKITDEDAKEIVRYFLFELVAARSRLYADSRDTEDSS